MAEAPHVVRARGEQAREELSHDLQALGEKLDIKHQIDMRHQSAVDNFKERLGMKTSMRPANYSQAPTGGSDSFASDAMSTVREHPLAALALGYGASTLFGSFRNNHFAGSDSRNGHGVNWAPGADDGPGIRARVAGTQERAMDAVSGAGDKVGSMAGDMSAKASDVKESVASAMSDQASSISEKAGQLGESASSMGSAVAERASSMSGTVTEVLPSSRQDLERDVSAHMLAFGIGAAAVGAIASLLAPRTQWEDSQMGDVKERLVEGAQSKAMEAKDVVQSHVGTGVSAVTETIKEEVGSVKEELTGGEGADGDDDSSDGDSSDGGSSDGDSSGEGATPNDPSSGASAGGSSSSAEGRSGSIFEDSARLP